MRDREEAGEVRLGGGRVVGLRAQSGVIEERLTRREFLLASAAFDGGDRGRRREVRDGLH